MCSDDLDYGDMEALRDAHVARFWQDEDFQQVVVYSIPTCASASQDTHTALLAG